MASRFPGRHTVFDQSEDAYRDGCEHLGDELRRLDLPGVLEMFHPRKAETCSLLLLSLEGERALVYVLGGWPPPLGVALRADGLAVVMMVISAIVTCAVGIFAHAEFSTPVDMGETRASSTEHDLRAGEDHGRHGRD